MTKVPCRWKKKNREGKSIPTVEPLRWQTLGLNSNIKQIKAEIQEKN
jgi:hypothetical protein